MSAPEEILVTIVVPVKNGDYWLKSTLTALLNQKVSGKSEILVVDSGSTDKSLEIIKSFPVRLIEIDPRTFNHGATRNLAVRQARGKYVAMTVQDALPADEYWLQRLMDGFDDERVAGVCGQQGVPHNRNANPIEWFRPQSEHEIIKYYFPDTATFEKLLPAEKRQVCAWDNVTAMYRKDVLERVLFQPVTFAEDALWAKSALMNGYSIVYNKAAIVYHYHLEEPAYTVRRLFTVYYHFHKYFGYSPPYVESGFIRKLKDLKLLLKEKISWMEKWKWYWYNQELRRNINTSVKLFHRALAAGENALEKEHDRLCKDVPQAIKPGGI
jgi:rhamnosyltransferase